jgi:hypothetical protein
MGTTGRIDPVTDPGLSFAAWRRAMAGKDDLSAPPALRSVIREGPDQAVEPAVLAALRAYYLQEVCRSTEAAFADARSGLADVRRQRSEAEAAQPSTFVFRDLDTPRDAFVMIRGQYDKPGEKVEPATPAFLPPLQKQRPDGRATRLDLARWLTDRSNPLTARVTVNRFWQQIFGTGLVETSHDLGTQGSVPSHPELLDWLALWWQDQGWDTRRLLRLMVTSAAFRRDSAAPAEAWLQDPGNRRLARGPRFRLDAEQLRDQALFSGGLMVMDMGGKGVRPYQPPNIWEPVGFVGSNTRFYEQDRGPSLYRRSLYTFLKRTAPPPLMVNFDAPNREQSCSRRERSNTPLQALQLMNDVQFVEAARALAARTLQDSGETDGRLASMFRRVLTRSPRPDELAVLRTLLENQLTTYRAAPADAGKAIRFGESVPPDGVDASELAAWAMVANAILNLDEATNRN